MIARGKGDEEYFRIRDFEYTQPLYDLAFALELAALAASQEPPKYRIFSLWKAAYSLDGYGTLIDEWLGGAINNSDLDYVPSARIRQYLIAIKETGMIPELSRYHSDQHERSRQLRAVRGLGPTAIAQTLRKDFSESVWVQGLSALHESSRQKAENIFSGVDRGPWQSAHIVPPALRFLRRIEKLSGEPLRCTFLNVNDPFESVRGAVNISVCCSRGSFQALLELAASLEPHFGRVTPGYTGSSRVTHQMGWILDFTSVDISKDARTILTWAKRLDPLYCKPDHSIQADLHLHSSWSDGSASLSKMAEAVVKSGLSYFAITDHSRSEKLQNGLTPVGWLRQAASLSLITPVCPVLHGIEVDILRDGSLDLPNSLLLAADIVVASVHSSWSDSTRENTDRLIRAIESGVIDVIGHPTSAVIGTIGVPDYQRASANVYWAEVFAKCAQWQVALELNCFPSRLDLPIALLRQAADAGCYISLGSDAHARSHLKHLRFGHAALQRVATKRVLNLLTYSDLKRLLDQSRRHRQGLVKQLIGNKQGQFDFHQDTLVIRTPLNCTIQLPHRIPDGSVVVGIDLTAGNKLTGVAVLRERTVETCSVKSDAELLAIISAAKPLIVSIDSPLGLPGGGQEIDPIAGIVRVAERDLSSIGIPAYPALIDSMKDLTLRGIKLKRDIESLSNPPTVIESYPGAAQDILSIPRKQKSLTLLREGLRHLEINGSGLDTKSHDEMDAITSAIVGRYFEDGQFEAMGIPSEAQLIVPKVPLLSFADDPIICLSGKTGAGKSVVARYLSVFYGFRWIQTRELIRALLEAELLRPIRERCFQEDLLPDQISEKHLRLFGSIILRDFDQKPLREALSRKLSQHRMPTVVDSIRDLRDLDQSTIGERPVRIWYIDCNEKIIRNRVASRPKLGIKRLHDKTTVDDNVISIRSSADCRLGNDGSLEELRWKVDDNLFADISLDY